MQLHLLIKKVQKYTYNIKGYSRVKIAYFHFDFHFGAWFTLPQLESTASGFLASDFMTVDGGTRSAVALLPRLHQENGKVKCMQLRRMVALLRSF